MGRRQKEFFNQIAPLAKIPGLFHAFSAKKDGDCHVHRHQELWPNLNAFLKKIEVNPEALVLMEQVHGSRIQKAGHQHVGKMIEAVDGLVTNQKNLFLLVKTADCLPLFFYDPVGKIVGLAHAGWRGVVKNIGVKMIDRMIMMGCLPENIVVGVGPCLCDNCHWRQKPVAQQQLTQWSAYLKPEGDKIRVRMKAYCLDRLKESGVKTENIHDAGLCTYERSEEYFSYQAAKEKGREDKEGRMVGLIGMRE